LALPSRIAARSPKAKTAIAAAVERPTPGSASMSFATFGKPLRAISRAAACRLRPRA
jgi:hypothetical protein